MSARVLNFFFGALIFAPLRWRQRQRRFAAATLLLLLRNLTMNRKMKKKQQLQSHEMLSTQLFIRQL